MKRSVIFCAILILVLLCISSSCGFAPSQPDTSTTDASTADTIYVPKATPTVDGNIDANEYQAASKVVIDAQNSISWIGSVPEANSIELYAAYDDNCLYLAGSVVDPEINGDKFQISLNLGNVFQSADFNRAIFYTWSLNTDDSVDVLRQESKTDGTIAKIGKGSKTDNGWQFEVAMQWDMLAKDAQLKSGKTVEIKEGLPIDFLVCYLDSNQYGEMVNAYGSPATSTMAWDPDSFRNTYILGK